MMDDRDDPGGATRHALALRGEGVTVDARRDGRYVVDFTVFGWFPHVLPSEEDEDQTDSQLVYQSTTSP